MTEPDVQGRVQRCVCGNLRMAARLVTQRYDDALRPAGLRIMQFTLLARLHAVDRVTMTELAEQASLDRTTLTRNLKPLIERGYVRVVAGKDQRERLVTVTDSGRAALREALPLWEQAQTSMTDGLGQEATSALLSLLRSAGSVASAT
jgi:DNA-binding MarR family transcriptional regulator